MGKTIMNCITLTLATVLSLTFSQASAQDFNKGLAAAQAGDYATAFKEWMPLAEAGGAESQNMLGTMHFEGLGVVKDHEEAIKWFKLAAEQDIVEAQIKLGNMYYSGIGVLQNYAEAIKWYRQSAQKGSAVGQHLVSRMYYEGKGVAQDYDEAMNWYLLSVDLENAFEQYKLGGIYGNGVLTNKILSYMWYNISAANGEEDSGTHRDNLAKEMTQADISKAQAMARECMASGYKKCGY
tara:strand:- start:118 stop:831 length:714 start_codon:yes stop_codon:yes gene_type:complete